MVSSGQTGNNYTVHGLGHAKRNRGVQRGLESEKVWRMSGWSIISRLKYMDTNGSKHWMASILALGQTKVAEGDAIRLKWSQ